MSRRMDIAGAFLPIRTSRLAVGAAAAILLFAPLVSAGCGRKSLPPTVGTPEDIMKNVDGTVGPMPGTPGYKPPKQ